jgi:hypothetical protein
MEATVHWYVQQGLVTRPLPRFTGQWTASPDQPAGGGSLFDAEATEQTQEQTQEQEPRP